MNRPILFYLLVGVAAIAGSASVSRAQCINNDGTFTLQRTAPPSDDTFATSGPVSGDSRFKFELELGSDLESIFVPDDNEDAALAAEPEAATDDTTAPATETAEAAPASPTIFSLDADSSSAADLESVELGTQPLMSREEYLDSQAREINACF